MQQACGEAAASKADRFCTFPRRTRFEEFPLRAQTHFFENKHEQFDLGLLSSLCTVDCKRTTATISAPLHHHPRPRITPNQPQQIKWATSVHWPQDVLRGYT